MTDATVPDQPEAAAGGFLNSEHPEAVIALVLHYSRLRAQYRLGEALWRQFPSEEEWQGFLESREFLEGVDEFAQVLKDMRDALSLGGLMTPEDVQTIGAQNHERAMYAVEELAAVLELPGEEIISASL
jgi:hypothetical protein